MDELVHQIAAGIKLAIVFGGSGAMIAIGMIGVCRYFKWAPINITVNVNEAHLPSTPNREDAGT